MLSCWLGIEHETCFVGSKFYFMGHIDLMDGEMEGGRMGG